MDFDLETKEQNGQKKTVAVADANDLDELDKRTANVVKAALGVDKLDLDGLADKLRPKVRDPVVDTQTWSKVKTVNTVLGQAQVPVTNHRYTIDVPDVDEKTVLNLGHGDTGRDLVDAGISGRTRSHIHFHTTDNASMVALGGPTGVKLGDLADPKAVLSSNEGIGAVTNGHIWAEAKGQLNLAARDQQAVLRAHTANVRVQADKASTEVAAGSDVVVAAKKNVKIVADSSVAPGDNGYGLDFDSAITEASGTITLKDIVTAQDIVSSAASLYSGAMTTCAEYKAGTIASAQLGNDTAKHMVDVLKIGSSLARFIAGKTAPGQVKIAASTFASMTGRVAASIHGHLSASVTSLVSASLIGGTASIKGLTWASVWATLGVSVRTVKGKASLSSDEGTAHVKGAKGVFVSSKESVSIGGDKTAELKSPKSVWIAGGQRTKVAAGKGDGMALLLGDVEAYVGTVTSPDTPKAAPRKVAYVRIQEGKEPNVQLRTEDAYLAVKKGSYIIGKADTVALNGKKVNIG